MEDVTPNTPDLPTMRGEYVSQGLVEADLAEDWPTQFGRWLAEAVAAGLTEPNAMVLATADAARRPRARSLLLKGDDLRGFVFFTNSEWRRGAGLAANPYGGLVFPWYPLHRQVLVSGPVERTSRAETEDYFAIRPRGAQLGAWASAQSQPIPDRAALEGAWAAAERRVPPQGPAPPPPGGGPRRPPRP